MLSLYGTASKHPNLYVVTGWSATELVRSHFYCGTAPPELTELLCQLIHDNDTKNPVDVKLSLSVAIGVAKGVYYTILHCPSTCYLTHLRNDLPS